MAKNMRRLALDDGLPAAQKLQLQGWLRANSTGDARIRAGVPASWQVGDKTGTGDYGVANDVAVLWPAQTARAPIVLAIFTNQVTKTANANDDVVASAARIVVDTMR
jgi:beta-lactamase class A